MDLIRNGSNQKGNRTIREKKAEDIVKAAEQEPEIIDILECFVTFYMQKSMGKPPIMQSVKRRSSSVRRVALN
ncbi:MAG TPA: hypothetical protein VE524_02880 [Nitrososphaeraceae archaeon]|nr:hypothetical protein [Nitrososphaeraceae archaeon]